MKKIALTITLLMLVIGISANAVFAITNTVSLISTDPAGVVGNDSSEDPAVTPDGRYIVFQSSASNLVPNDTNGFRDIFRKDTQTGKVELVSVNSDEVQGNNLSSDPTISADGRYVAFKSAANNWVTTSYYQVYIRDMVNGTTTLASHSTGGDPSGAAVFTPFISADGNFVVYTTRANNLVSEGSLSYYQVILYDRVNDTNTLISKADGVSGNGHSYEPALSADGNKIVFHSYAKNLDTDTQPTKLDIFVYDRTTGIMSLESKSSTGTQATANSARASISADGTKIVFYSDTSNFDTDTNGMRDVFLRDLNTGVTTLISVSDTGVQGNADSQNSFISADGNFVAYVSYATNLIDGASTPEIQIYLRDLNAGTTVLVSQNSLGEVGDDTSNIPCLGISGDFVVFESSASNFVSGDTNSVRDIYIVGNVTEAIATPTTEAKQIPDAGFAQGRVSALPERGEKFNASVMTLGISKLGVSMNIVGVPQSNNGNWDVAWLGENAGWLAGSAYPTWNGNSVLVGHVWNADNTPGPFIGLADMRYGDEVIIQAPYGEYVYAVREVKKVSADRVNEMMKHQDKAWLTLVTCDDYNEANGSYDGRLLVTAVLVEIR